MRIEVFEAEPRDREAFAALASSSDLVFHEAPMTVANAAASADAVVVSTFIYSELTRETLAQLPALRFIATRSTGLDHIDLPACAERGVRVANVPTYGANTVAEHVFALLLSISHRMPEALDRARHGRFSPEGLEGFDLAGRTMGVVGVGAIGRHVVRIAQGFGMQVLGFDSAPDPELAGCLGFEFVSLHDLLTRSDVVTLHAPALPGGAPLLDKAAFAEMKTGAVLINTARGSLVDSRALVAALESGKVAGAGLDVLSEEPLIREEAELIVSGRCEVTDVSGLLADHVLLRSPNVLVTPHSGFNTREAVRRIAETSVANIQAYLDGRPVNLVMAPQTGSRRM